MPVEWPLAASAADRPVDPARPHAGRDRLPVVMADFFLDEGSRLTDEERALMAAMLRGLVADIADELIVALPPLLGAKAERLRDGLYRQLRDAGNGVMFPFRLRRAIGSDTVEETNFDAFRFNQKIDPRKFEPVK